MTRDYRLTYRMVPLAAGVQIHFMDRMRAPMRREADVELRRRDMPTWPKQRGGPIAASLSRNSRNRVYCFDAKMAVVSPPPMSQAMSMTQAKPNTALAVTPQQDF